MHSLLRWDLESVRVLCELILKLVYCKIPSDTDLIKHPIWSWIVRAFHSFVCMLLKLLILIVLIVKYYCTVIKWTRDVTCNCISFSFAPTGIAHQAALRGCGAAALPDEVDRWRACNPASNLRFASPNFSRSSRTLILRRCAGFVRNA